jgi:hypothetical protein
MFLLFFVLRTFFESIGQSMRGFGILDAQIFNPKSTGLKLRVTVKSKFLISSKHCSA